MGPGSPGPSGLLAGGARRHRLRGRPLLDPGVRGTGLVEPAVTVIESGIALSVLVSALHAVRPLVPRGETLIAGGFGLLHGLAFATLLTELDLSRFGLVATLLGFNIGIEIAQLLVVPLVMPSLILLSRSATYSIVRVAAASVGAVLAVGWLLHRTGLTDANPVEPVSDLVNHHLVLAAGLAVLALVTSWRQRRRAVRGAATRDGGLVRARDTIAGPHPPGDAFVEPQ